MRSVPFPKSGEFVLGGRRSSCAERRGQLVLQCGDFLLLGDSRTAPRRTIALPSIAHCAALAFPFIRPLRPERDISRVHIAEVNSVLPQGVEEPLDFGPVASELFRFLGQPSRIFELRNRDVETGHSKIQDEGAFYD